MKIKKKGEIKMISISSIRSYMFCPMKLYLEQNFNEKIDRDILLYKTIKELRIDLQDLFQRNLRRLEKGMNLVEIEEKLGKNIEEYIKNSVSIMENSEKINIGDKSKKQDYLENKNKLKELDDSIDFENISRLEKEIEEEIRKIDEVEEMKIEIEAEAYFNMKILSLKAQKAMTLNEKDGSEIAEMFFPTSMYSYLMRDKNVMYSLECFVAYF